MFLRILKAIWSTFCNTDANKPDQYPPHQQQQQQQQHQQHQQHQQQPYQQQQQQQQYQQQPPHHHYTPTQDPNQANQSNDFYVSLRARANEHGDQMAQCFKQSHEAYSRKDGALAKELSNQGKEHQRQMEQLNRQASDWIFRANNTDSKPGEIDLHGLYVKEAIERADQSIQDAKRCGDKHISFIVGKGLHSRGGVAKIKPAIEQLIQKHNLAARIDPNNAGVLIVDIDDGRSRGGISVDEISRRLEDKDQGCVIM